MALQLFLLNSLHPTRISLMDFFSMIPMPSPRRFLLLMISSVWFAVRDVSYTTCHPRFLSHWSDMISPKDFSPMLSAPMMSFLFILLVMCPCLMMSFLIILCVMCPSSSLAYEFSMMSPKCFYAIPLRVQLNGIAHRIISRRACKYTCIYGHDVFDLGLWG